jgi:hypothetical protein
MKNIQLLFLFYCLGSTISVLAQCNPYYNFKEDASWEITNFSAKDKQIGRQVNSIKSIENVSNGWSALLNMQSYDKKDDLIFDKDVDIECQDGVIKLDMNRFFPQETMQAFKDMNMNIETENLEIPADLIVGKELKNASLKISGDIPFTMEVTVSNRKVEGKEKITTTAGTFDCFKVTYTITSKTIMTMESKGADWLAEGVGMVRSDNYDKKGKLTGYSLLTNFK